MNEIVEVGTALPVNNEQSSKADRWKTLVILLILINTVLASAFAGLQVNANSRASQSSAESQYDAILASSELNRASIQASYDLNTYAQNLFDQQTALVQQYTALQRQIAKDDRGYQDQMIESSASQARADRAKELSSLLTDPRYAPTADFNPPDTAAYMKDLYAKANEIVSTQNAAADRYLLWNARADAYVAVLTILAVAFFLYGIAQSVRPRLRLLFACTGLAIMVIGSLWGLTILLA